MQPGLDIRDFALRFGRSRNSRRAIAGIALIGAAVACHDAARVEVDYQRDQLVPRSQTVVTIEDGVHHYVITGQALVGSGARPSYSTLNSGTLRVKVAMADGAGVVATGLLSLPLRADNGYGISIAIDSVNPVRNCFGCAGSAAFPLRTAVGHSVRDSMWLTWGSNSISNPVTY